MSGPTFQMRPARSRGVGLAAAIAAAGLLSADAAGQQVSAHLIGSGGGTSRAGCLTLQASIGEAAIGRSSGGAFVMHAGYPAGAASQRRDAIFNHGFQGCQP